MEIKIEEYRNAGAGLKIMFIAAVGNMICLLFIILMRVAGNFSAVAIVVFNLLSVYVPAILCLAGLYQAGEYFVCTSVSDVLDELGELGEHSVAGLGRLVWKVVLGCYVVLAVNLVFEFDRGELVVVFFSTVYVVIRMVFLYQSFNALQSKAASIRASNLKNPGGRGL